MLLPEPALEFSKALIFRWSPNLKEIFPPSPPPSVGPPPTASSEVPPLTQTVFGPDRNLSNSFENKHHADQFELAGTITQPWRAPP